MENTIDNITYLIKHSSREWGLAAGLLAESSTAWWLVNPMGSVTFSESLQIKALLQSDTILRETKETEIERERERESEREREVDLFLSVYLNGLDKDSGCAIFC
ncbi:hypothetical protein ACET3Z_014913 [Daucus carota]